MKQWEVYDYEFPAPVGKHPVVVISNNATIEKLSFVNVLKCVSQRGDRKPTVFEVVLNGADGLDGKTLVQCDVTYLVKKEALKTKRGTVTRERKQKIGKVYISLLNPF